MKLFTRYNRINLLAIIIVFLLSGVSYYFLLRYILINQVDEDLKIEQHEIQNYAAKYGQLPEIIAVKDQQINYNPVASGNTGKTFSIVHPRHSHRADDYRKLDFYISIQNNWYQVSVSKSLEGTDHLIQSIAGITLITILLILLLSFFINRLILEKLWQPFYDSLNSMRLFEIGKNKQPVFKPTNIDEFALLNRTLEQATAKADRDYQHLKEFTENASHELQTPLAVIQAKLDVLIQDEKLSEPQSRMVQAAYEAIQRLSRLNHGLLLLTKIENGQYADTSHIDVSKKIIEKLTQFQEMITSKNIQATTSFTPSTIIEMNTALAEILFNNLFSNAIKYNLPGGTIKIMAGDGIIKISNTGEAKSLDTNRLFKRFSKSSSATEGIGLGLAIVQQVADVSGFSATYRYEDEQHHFLLSRKTPTTGTINYA